MRSHLRRPRTIVAVALSGTLGSLCLAASPTAAASTVTQCAQYAQNFVNSSNVTYDDWTDAFGGNPECLTESVTAPSFMISQSFVKKPLGHVQAYPHISVASFKPTEISKIGREALTWSTTQRTTAGSAWAADTDFWVSNTRTAVRAAVLEENPAADAPAGLRAEMLIWLNRSGPPGFYPTPVHNPVYKIDGLSWYLVRWLPSGKRTWTYIQWRAVHPLRSVAGLQMLPFFTAAAQAHLLKLWWWQQSIEAGFEIWSGGTGLAVTGFKETG